MKEPRTVTLPTEDYGDVTIPEPSWCAGHASHRPDTARVEISHRGPEHRLTHQGELLFTVFLGQAPFPAPGESGAVGLYVEQTGYARTLDPAGLYDLAAALDSAADHFREEADRLTAILSGGDQ